MNVVFLDVGNSLRMRFCNSVVVLYYLAYLALLDWHVCPIKKVCGVSD